MRLAWSLVVVSLCLEGCATDVQERVKDYNEDGVYLFQRGDYRSARESFQAALALDRQNVALMYNIGQCYDRTGDLPHAGQYYCQCLQICPNHPDYRQALAGVLVREGRAPEATRMIEDWLAREPKMASAYAVDGWLLHQTGDLPRAQARLQQALELDPHEPRALVELGSVYEAMQRPERAIALYEKALDQNPRQPDVSHRVHQLTSQQVGRPHPD